MVKRFVLGAAAAALVLALPAPAGAADSAGVERKIAKEPKYEGKPAYCLLVFGADRKTRVWVVRDGNAAYVDRNANGDLTEAGEKVTATPDVDDGDEVKVTVTEFDLGDLALEVGGKKPYTGLFLTRRTYEPKAAAAGSTASETSSVWLNIRDLHSQSATPEFAAKAADAPIVFMDGPLEIRLRPDPKGETVCFARDEDAHAYTFQIGTMGLGTGTWAPIGYDQVPEEVHPLAELSFPAAKAGAPPIVTKFALDSRC
jgi:hypothetical protein